MKVFCKKTVTGLLLVAQVWFCIHGTFAEGKGYFDLRSNLRGPTFGLSSPGPLERNLADFYADLLSYCGRQGPWGQDYCYLVDAINEFLATGRALKSETVESPNLPLTLASGMHPFSLAKGFLSGTGSFDVAYARFLIVQSIIVELWPLAPEAIRPEGSNESVAWLTSFSPFSYLFRISQQGTCIGEEKKGCAKKKLALQALQSVFATLEEDQDLMNRIQATHDFFRSQNFSARRISLHQGLLGSVTDLSRGNLISFFSSPNAPNAKVSSVKNYFASMEKDASVHFTSRYEFKNEPCADLNGTLQFIKNMKVEGFEKVTGDFECQVTDGYLSVVGGAAFEEIMQQGLLWRFTFFQLRLMIGQITDYINGMDQVAVEQMYYQALLDDIYRVKEQVAFYPNLDDESSYRSDSLKDDKRVLWEALLDIFDQSQTLKGGLQ